MSKFILLALLSVSVCLSSCSPDEDPPEEVKDDTPKEQVIKITTEFGEVYMWLNKGTPSHRSNFLKLAESQFYDSTLFHRIAPGLAIQGGDPNTKNEDKSDDGKGGPGYSLDPEIDTASYTHAYGAVGAAKAIGEGTKSNGSQFYIVVNPEGLSALDGQYTLFGQIFHGMAVVDQIAEQPKDNQSTPLSPIPMKVEVLTLSQKILLENYSFTVP